jgi:acetyl esterase/lipase
MRDLDEAILAEARAFNAEISHLLSQRPPVHLLPPEVARAARRDGRSVFPPPEFLPRARDVRAPTRDGEIRLRVVPPERRLTGAYLHMHGGGWVLGCCDEQDGRLAALADATGLCAVSVDYRLAPEYPYPAGPDDCEDVAAWLLERGLDELGIPPRVAVGGESAGAHLAVTTLLRLRDRHGIPGSFFLAANLVYGVYDLSMTPSQRNWGDRELILSTPLMHWFGRAYAGDRPLDELRDPDISPLYAELRDMPPALFSVGEHDPLLDDSLFMAARWRAAGNEAELQVWPEAIHGFNAFPLRLAREANASQYDFLRRAIGD